MLSGKSLHCKGDEVGMVVRATVRNDDDESQHWIRKGSNIMSKTLKKYFIIMATNYVSLI